MAARRALLLLVAVVLAVVPSGCAEDPSTDAGPTPTAGPSSASASPTPPTQPPQVAVGDPRFVAARAALRDSVVEVVQRPNVVAAWRQVCTGNTIRYAGRVFVLTARHCVQGRAVAELGIRVRGAVETVTHVAVRPAFDVALLEVDGATVSGGVEALRLAPGLPPGLEGAPAYAAGLPAAAGGRLVARVGEYLGRVQDPSEPTQLLDLVGLTGRAPEADACNYGASGSLGLVAPAYVLGPLAVRNNVVNPAGSNGDDDPVVDRKNRAVMAEQLGRSLAGFPTICGYAELSRSVLDSLAR